MLNKIKEFFHNEIHCHTTGKSSAVLSDEKRRLASAALMIEVAITDNEFDQSELVTLQKSLREQFNISASDCEKLTELAHSEAQDSTSLYQFTSLINEYSSPEEKFDLIKSMWLIAYADGNLDKYEEYVIRKVAELIHVGHSDFIRAKLEARPDNLS